MIAQLYAAALPRTVVLYAGLFFAAAAGLLLWKRWVQYPLVICLACALSAGLFLVQSSAAFLPVSLYAGGEHQLTACVEEVRPSYAAGRVHARLRVQAIDGRRVRFRIVCPMLPDSIPGEIISGRFLLSELPQDDRRLARYADRVFLEAEPVGQMSWQQGEMGLAGRLYELRTQLARNVSRGMPRPFGGVAAAMTLGVRNGLAPQIQEHFRGAGLSHLLVVSGLHLSMLCGGLLPQKLFVGWRQRLRGVLALLLVLSMMALTGFTPSVYRAGIAAIVYHVGLIFFLPADPLTSLGLSALILCGTNCYAACDVGLQLSYSATLGVLFAAQTLIRAKKLERWQRLAPGAQRLLGGLMGLLAPSFFAAVFTLPVQLWHQMQVSGTSMLANLLSLWIIRPLLICGMACAVLGFIPQLLFLYHAASLAAAVLTRLLVGIAAFCAQLPFARLALPREYALFVWLTLGILGLLLWHARKMRWMWLAAPCFVLAAVCCAAGLNRDVIHIMVVGSVSAPCVVITQNDQTIVLYQGRASNGAAVESTLSRLGRGQITLLVDLRHADTPIPLTAQRVLRADALSSGQVQEYALGSLELLVLHQEKGNLALVQAEGYRAAFCTGTVRLAQPCRVDLLVMGGKSVPTELLPRRVLFTRPFAWPDRPPKAELLYAQEDPWLRLRPGRSCQYFEVNHVTHTQSV